MEIKILLLIKRKCSNFRNVSTSIRKLSTVSSLRITLQLDQEDQLEKVLSLTRKTQMDSLTYLKGKTEEPSECSYASVKLSLKI